jgi:hypothetical protein
MTLSIPVVCLVWVARWLVNYAGSRQGGANPEATFTVFMQALKYLKDHSDLREGYARKAISGLMVGFSWQAKREMLLEFYAQLTQESGINA